jgi:LDH2 family malate/lactate/ureidoglycolate dehydrogenase
MSDKRYRAEELQHFCASVFTHLGFSGQDAEVAAKSLLRAELEGAGSHGISRLAIYAKRIKEGRIEAQPNISTEPFGSVLKVDGGNGLGQVVSYRALEKAIPLAKESGIVGIFVRNSNHFGTAAFFCQMACQSGMALIAMTNSPSGIPPWGGKKAYFGTNPIAFGFPTKQEPPVIIDMSSSVVARGKIILANKLGKEIPLGWAIDEEGIETTDPAAALRGAVLPLGGAKGYALAMAVEILSGVLSEAAFGPHVNNLYKDQDPPANVGHSFILLDIAKWMPLEDYYSRIEQFLQEVKEVPHAKDVQEILYPGERRYRTYLENNKQGIMLSQEIQDELVQLGGECGLAFPDFIS